MNRRILAWRDGLTVAKMRSLRPPRAHFLCALALTLGFPSLASAQTEAVTIDVDATAPGPALERVWAYYGYDEVNYTTTPDGEELLRTLAAIHTAPVRVRTHFLFNTGDGTPTLKWGSTNIYTEDVNRQPIYDYTIIDRIMDATVGAGTLPLVEIGFMPEALSTQPIPYQNSGTNTLDSGSFYPPRDYAAWAALVSAWAQHVKERYPGAEGDWQWELWNEPDLPYWHGTVEEFARLYDYTEAALHAVFPATSLGGPAVANPERSFLGQFLEHCATGTNAVTGERGTRLDMVSFHAKGGVRITDGHVQLDLGTQLRLHRSGFQTVANSAFAHTPIVISEADPDGCAACSVLQRPENTYRNSPAYGTYEVAMMKRSLDLAAEMDVDLRGVLTWAFTFPGTPYFAGYRALTTNGIHMPVLNAFKLLGSLSGDRLPLASNGARPLAELIENGVRAQPDVDGLAAIDGERVQMLIWNYHDNLTPAEVAPVTLSVKVPATFGTHATLTHTRVDENHGDAFSAWVAQGSPKAPSAVQLTTLRQAMEPVVLERERVVSVTNGIVAHSFELPRFGISLVTLTPAQPPKASEAPRAGGAGCSCRSSAPAPVPPSALLALVLGLFGVVRRRYSWRQ
jgi:xylan 1,4-beta-xylosidase